MAGNPGLRGAACEIAAVIFGAVGWPVLSTLALGAALGIAVDGISTIIHEARHEGRLGAPDTRVEL